jgi:hypothetical protein
MRGMLSLLAPTLALGALLVPAFGTAQQSSKTIKNGSWKGVIIEESCYLEVGVEKATAADHSACAMQCLKKGRPLGILTDADGYMRIIGNSSKDNYASLTQYVGKRVAVTGGLSQPPQTIPLAAMNRVHGDYRAVQIDIVKITTAKQ